MDMAEENKAGTKEKVEPIKADTGKRQRSSIAFPYYALDDAVALARAINNHVGGARCSVDQVAAWLQLSPKSSGFRARLSAATLFGLVNSSNLDAIHLAEWGRAVVDAKREREGRARAFLSVPLYRAVFDNHKGEALPPTAALENELVSLGVAATLKTTARQVLERSAESAGFYEAGRDRLVMPGFRSSEGSTQEHQDHLGGGGGGVGGPPSGQLPLAISVLLDALPEPLSVWPKHARAKWMQALSNAFDSIYKTDESSSN
jgi:hypothetical protein